MSKEKKWRSSHCFPIDYITTKTGRSFNFWQFVVLLFQSYGYVHVVKLLRPIHFHMSTISIFVIGQTSFVYPGVDPGIKKGGLGWQANFWIDNC